MASTAAMTERHMRTADLDYHLPPELIATHPHEPRDMARLLVYHRATNVVEHRVVRDLPELLRAGDALVLNTSAVLPARFIARRASGGRVEGLVVEPVVDDGRTWRAMVRGSARFSPGDRLELEAPDESMSGETIELVSREGAAWLVRFSAPAVEVLAALGRTPLPPYILRARGERGETRHGRDAALVERLDRAQYQTVFADRAEQRSVAAPTAGLHFTPGLLDALITRGVDRIDVSLHVGPGTFRPVTAEQLDEHPMHAESWSVSAAALEKLVTQRARGGRIVAVGTTAVRTLESLPEPLPPFHAHGTGLHGSTRLLIAPPYTFRWVDALLTNFHLPRSTLLALVAALVGLDRLHALYAEAIAQRYRFYSFGDAVLIL